MAIATTPAHWDQVAQRIEEVRNLARSFAGGTRGHFGARLREIRLFGSAARGDWQEDSDVDVLVLLDKVTSEDRAWLAERANNLGLLDTGILISVVTLSAGEFQHLRDRERLFAAEVDREGMPL